MPGGRRQQLEDDHGDTAARIRQGSGHEYHLPCPAMEYVGATGAARTVQSRRTRPRRVPTPGVRNAAADSRATVVTVESRRVPDNETIQRFQREVIPLSPDLYRNARRLTGRHPEAEDLLQETLIRAYTGFNSFEPGTNLRAWLHTIMRNRWRSGYRRSQRRPVEFFRFRWTDHEDAGWRVAPQQRSAEDLVLAELPDGAVREAFDSLPTSLRIVLFYADVEGFSYRQIADLLDIPMGTVMSRLHRGRRRMRDRLTTTTTPIRATGTHADDAASAARHV